MKKRVIAFIMFFCMTFTGIAAFIPSEVFANENEYFTSTSSESEEANISEKVWDGVQKTEVVSIENTYTIDSADQLAWFSEQVNAGNNFDGKHIFITGNMDLGNNTWEPIGNGKILECSIEIRDCHITRMTTNALNNGLFGNVSIKNLIVDNLVIDESEISKDSWDTHNLGLLAGALTVPLDGYVKISNSQFRGTLSNTHNFDYGFTGGVVGKLTFEAGNGYVIFENNVIEATITGSNVAGGIVGFVVDADLVGSLDINKTYVNCNISASNSYGYEDTFAGGLVGILNGDNVSISQCTVQGSVSSSAYEGWCGGLVGHGIYNSLQISNCSVQANINSIFGGWYGSKYNGGGFLGCSLCKDNTNSFIKNSYFNGSINSGVAFVTRDANGGDSSIPIVNCYFDMEKTGLSADMMHSSEKNAVLMTNVLNGCAGYTSEQMQDEASFVNWDFESIWIMDEDAPRIRTEEDNLREELIKNFNEYVYRANYLLDDTNICAMSKTTLFNGYTPCSLLEDAAEESGLEKKVIAWEMINEIFEVIENPISLADEIVEPQDMYSAILMNILESSVEFSLVEKRIEDDAKLCKDFTSSIRELMDKAYKIDVFNDNDFKNLTSEQKAKLSDYAELWFKENDATFIMDNANEFFKGMTLAFDTVNSIEDFYKRIVSGLMLQNISEEMKVVLREAYYNSGITDNKYLQKALEECIQIIDDSTEKMIQRILLEEITMTGVNLVEWLFEEVLWEDILNSFYVAHPVVAILMVTYKGVLLGVNEFFSADEISEQYLRMLAIEDIENLFDFTYYSLANKFLDEQTTYSAKIYLSAIGLVYQARVEDCNQAYEFVDAVDSSTFSKFMQNLGASDNESTKKSIHGFKTIYGTDYEESFIQWINKLEEDYPESGLYEYYDALYDNVDETNVNKEITVACPVDVYVYDEKGELVATSISGVVGCLSDTISVIQVDDEKTFLFYDNQEYTVQCIGTDSGSMDILIREFSDDESIIRMINYYDVSLINGIEYNMSVPAENLQKDEYILKDVVSEEVIEKGYDSLVNDAQYRLVIKNGTMEYNQGLFWDTSVYGGASAQLHAYLPEGYNFVKWESSCTENIFEDPYSVETMFVMPEEDCEIVALIEKEMKDITISALKQSIMWGNTIDQTKYSISGDGLAESDSIENIVLTPSTTEMTTNGTIGISGVKIVNENGEDVTENYNISYVTGSLVIEHNTNLPPTKIEVLKTNVDYTIGQVLNVDDLSVTAYYEDGYREEVTGYTTNADTIDMTTVGEKNLTISYTMNGETVTKDIIVTTGHGYTITLPEEQNGYRLTANTLEALWNGNVTITFELKDGFSKTENFTIRINGDVVTLNADETFTITNVVDNLDITVEGVADITAPAVEIEVSENIWNSFWNKITFGYFFNETENVTIKAEDVNVGSGVQRIEYYLSNEELDLDELIDVAIWTEYTKVFSINPNNEYVIYTKAVDYAGNTAYVSSEGIVLDECVPVISGIENDGIYCGDVIFSVTDEYLDKVYVDDVEVTLLDEKYTILADNKMHTITAVDKAGNKSSYKITVNYGVIENVVSGYTGTYDGQAHGILVSVSEPIGTSITYSMDGETYTETMPLFKDKGTHTVFYKIEKERYTTVCGETRVIITAKEISIVANDQTIMWGDTISQNKYDVFGLIDGDYIENIQLTPSTNEITDKGTISICDVKISSNGGKVVTNNYDISYTEAKLVIIHDRELVPTEIEVSKEVKEYKEGQILQVDDITVRVYYADGYSEIVSEYTTNMDEIDMSVAGEKELIITYSRNGHTITATIIIKVLDVTPPEILGIVGGGIYKGDVTFYITDKSLDKVFVDDVEVTLIDSSYTILADNKTHTIVARDKSGNEAIYIITVEYGVIEYEETDFIGIYDGMVHGINISVINSNEAKITYSTDGSVYSEENPLFVDAGIYTVYYKIERDRYMTISDSATVCIDAKDVLILAENQSVVVGTVIDTSKYNVVGLVNGDSIISINMEQSTTEVTDNGIITLNDAKIVNANGKDVTNNYVLVYINGKWVIEEEDIEEEIPDTGDTTNVLWWSLLMTMGIVIVLFGVKSKKSSTTL